jgi:hypothetical protein
MDRLLAGHRARSLAASLYLYTVKVPQAYHGRTRLANCLTPRKISYAKPPISWYGFMVTKKYMQATILAIGFVIFLIACWIIFKETVMAT